MQLCVCRALRLVARWRDRCCDGPAHRLRQSVKKEDDSAQAAAPGGEDPLRYRAKVHTELGANYFQRGQMSVALEELRRRQSASTEVRCAHSILGWCTLTWRICQG